MAAFTAGTMVGSNGDRDGTETVGTKDGITATAGVISGAVSGIVMRFALSRAKIREAGGRDPEDTLGARVAEGHALEDEAALPPTPQGKVSSSLASRSYTGRGGSSTKRN